MQPCGQRQKSGFTIVELLIVIVVIAILAAITVVAYNGIQERANNATVVSDLAALKKKIEIYKIDNGDLYPSGSSSGLASLDFKMTKGAYAASPTTANNFWYCRTASRTQYSVIALGKSGAIYYITEADGPTEYSGGVAWDGANHNCNTMIRSNLGWPYAGYADADTTSGPYRGWVGGN